MIEICIFPACRIRLPVILFCAALAHSAIAADDIPLTGAAYQLADQAYTALAENKPDMAEQAVIRALQLQPDNLQLGLLLLDVQTRKGDIDAAQRQADALLIRFPNRPLVLVQRGYLAQRQQHHQAAMDDFYAALNQLGLDENQQRNVRMAWADSALASRQPKVVLDALAPFENDRNTAIQLRLANAHLALGDKENAHKAAELAIAAASNNDERLYANQLLEQTKPVVLGDLDQAYAFMRDKNDREAVQAFRRGFTAAPGSAAQYADAGYAALRIGDNATAIEWFKNFLDADEKEHRASGSLIASESDQNRVFGIRRTIQELDRSFGVVASASYQSSSGFSPVNSINVMQGGLEAYWKPQEFGNQNGHLFQLFTQVYETLYDGTGGQTGSSTAQGSVGARYKPIGDINLILTAEKRFRMGNLSSNDTLLRAGYSTGDGTDLNPANRNWSTWQFYTEGAYFVNAARYIQSLEARYGHRWKLDSLSDNLVITPHVVLMGDFDNRETVQTALGLGPGISLTKWFREDKYQAPASWFDLTAQYRLRLSNAQRAQGWTLRATFWY